MTLLRDIQNAATDEKTNVATLLRKATILAARLRSPVVEHWLNNELNGYGKEDELPTYRIIPASARPSLTNGSWHFPDAAVNTSLLPEQHKAWGTEARLPQPISAIAELAASKTQQLQCPWSHLHIRARNFVKQGREWHQRRRPQ